MTFPWVTSLRRALPLPLSKANTFQRVKELDTLMEPEDTLPWSPARYSDSCPKTGEFITHRRTQISPQKPSKHSSFLTFLPYLLPSYPS